MDGGVPAPERATSGRLALFTWPKWPPKAMKPDQGSSVWTPVMEDTSSSHWIVHGSVMPPADPTANQFVPSQRARCLTTTPPAEPNDPPTYRDPFSTSRLQTLPPQSEI